jgi:hypothetical protein
MSTKGKDETGREKKERKGEGSSDGNLVHGWDLESRGGDVGEGSGMYLCPKSGCPPPPRRNPLRLPTHATHTHTAIVRLEGLMDSNFEEKEKLLTNKEYMEIYTTCYTMCTQRPPNNWSEKLYVKHNDTITDYLRKTVLPALEVKNTIYTHMDIYIYTFMHIYTYTCIYLHIHTYAHTHHTHIFILIYVYIYIHTYIHTYGEHSGTEEGRKG